MASWPEGDGAGMCTGSFWPDVLDSCAAQVVKNLEGHRDGPPTPGLKELQGVRRAGAPPLELVTKSTREWVPSEGGGRRWGPPGEGIPDLLILIFSCPDLSIFGDIW